jgi:lipoate-protein ligase B
LYRLIVPCGVTAYGVCSLASLGRPAPDASALAPRAQRALAERLGRVPAEFLDVSEAPLAELGAWLSSSGAAAAESVDC